MALGTVRIQGGDTTARNTNALGDTWLSAKQFTILPTYLTKVVIFVPTASTSACVWFLDTAAGSGASTDPSAVLNCPNGFTTTLDFGDYGKIFTQGLYIVISSNEPDSPGDNPNVVADNTALISIDYKVK